MNQELFDVIYSVAGVTRGMAERIALPVEKFCGREIERLRRLYYAVPVITAPPADPLTHDALTKIIRETVFKDASESVMSNEENRLALHAAATAILAAFPGKLQLRQWPTHDEIVDILSQTYCKVVNKTEGQFSDHAIMELQADAILAAFPGKVQLRRMPTYSEWSRTFARGMAARPGLADCEAAAEVVMCKLAELAAPIEIDEDELALHLRTHGVPVSVDNSLRLARTTLAHLKDSANVTTAPAPVAIDEKRLAEVLSRALFGRERYQLDGQLLASCDNAARAAIAYFKERANVTSEPEGAGAPPGAYHSPEQLQQEGIPPPPSDARRKKALELWNVYNTTGKFAVSAIESFDQCDEDDRICWLAVAAHVEAEVRAAKRDSLVLAATAIFEFPRGATPKEIAMQRECHTIVCNLVHILDAEEGT